MELFLQQNQTDRDMIEIYMPHNFGEKTWLLSAFNIECFTDQGFIQRLEDGEKIQVTLEETPFK